MDAFVTNILTYSDSLMNLLQPNSFRLSITVIVIICIFSFLALLLLFYIFFKLVYQVRNKGSKPTKQNLENGKITSPPKNNSLSPPIPVFKSKRASFAEFKESSEKSIILGSAPSLRLPPLKSKATLPSEKRLSSENLDKLPAYLSKPSVTMASNFSSVYTTESPRESDFSFRESNITNDSDRIEEESTLSVISSYQFKTLEREAPPLLPTAPPSILLRNGWSVSSSTYQNASPYSESGSYPEFPPLPPNPESVSTNLDLEENHDDSLLLQPSSFPIQSETLLYPNPIISHEENNLGSTDQKPNDSDPSLTSSSTLKPTSNPKTSPLSVRTTYSLFPRLTSYANPFDITDFLDDLKN
ncbi:hypothetical protein HMI55_000487 [Coelomomyces lativittatus]|nr:hypothetical protein HMI55_000487 [Coelomomyces lativittatus]